jgi:hypothetical protein
MASRPVHKLVEELAKGWKPPKVGVGSIRTAPDVPAKEVPANSALAFAYASNLPEAIVFAGFLGDAVERPGGGDFQVLYLDLELSEWLLVEDSGILAHDQIRDDAVPFNQRRDVIWVKADAAVGQGSTSQSVEAQFLTGEFTKARDFEAPPGGATLAAATGAFCGPRTPSCCRIRSRS